MSQNVEQPPSASSELADLVEKALGDACVGMRQESGDLTLTVPRERIVEACTALRDAADLRLSMLVDLTSVDLSALHPDREPRFQVIYQLLSIGAGYRLFIEAGVPSDDCRIDTVTSLWPGAGFFEREVFDLMGIRFDGHPNLVRLVTPEDWQAHPLRKEFPLRGFNRP